MENEEKDLRGQVVGFRTCIICGKTFAKDMQNPRRQKCPECFKHIKSNSHRGSEVGRTEALFSEMKRNEQTEAQKRRERQRLRDEAWARWERENGVKPIIEDHGSSIIEIRGQRCGGGFSANR